MIALRRVGDVPGDTTEAKSMATGSQKQLGILDTLVPVMSGFKQLENAAVKKWGEEGRKTLTEGQRVEFTPEDSQKGPRAGDVRLIEG